MSFLISDTDIDFPHYVILKASAGAGKTRALTNRYVQFLLSERIPNNKLKNILAITFSNNAARVMKERILEVLKRLYQKEENTIGEFSNLLSIDRERLSQKAENAIEEILNNYSDFRVKTIDSFMATLFKASSTDLGYTPDFEITMNNNEILTYAFELFMRDAKEGSSRLKNLIEATDLLSEFRTDKSAYVWDAPKEILKTFKEFYKKESSTLKRFYYNKDLLNKKAAIEKDLKNIMERIISSVNNSDLERSGSCKIFDEFQEIIEKRKFQLLLDRGITYLPVKKPKKGPSKIDCYNEISSLWEEFQKYVEEFVFFYSMTYYYPYYEIYNDYREVLDKVRLKEGKVFIEDITKIIGGFLSDMVPDVYFRLSERIYHFLIDEFQDTSQLQWHNLYPLIENSLSVKGSLFVVGDTKQAIYTFRNADYRIMKELENNDIFPAAKKIVAELDINYRSGGRIVEFNEEVFKKRLPLNNEYKDAIKSGLTDFRQYPRGEKENKGYVELKIIDPSTISSPSGERINNGNDQTDEGKSYLFEIIDDLLKRGYSLRDIAVLSYDNQSVIKLSQWLNEKDIEILSYSSLDLRKRKISDELLALLKFLDYPLDNFSFAVFLKSTIYLNFLSSLQHSAIKPEVDKFLIKYRDLKEPLYKAFEKEYPDIWQRDFAELFRLTGYLPIYDLLSMAITRFRVFETIPEEEATFIKLLELANYFEGKGLSSIKDFVEFLSGDGEDEKVWDISMPVEADAVRLMTVHKAKGLEFPVVIFYMDKSEPPPKGFYFVEDGENFSVMRLNEELVKKSERLMAIKERISLEQKIEKLNTLYVALTRAEEELYVFTSLKNNKKEKAFAELVFDGDSFTLGNKLTPEEVALIKASKKERLPDSFSITHSFMEEGFPVEEGEIHIEEKQRGEVIHKVLSYIDYLEVTGDNNSFCLPEKIKERIDRLNRETVWKVRYEDIEVILKALLIGPLRMYYIPAPQRTVRNEVEFTSPTGALFRMDRVVIDRDSVTVIDYKTGHPTEEEHSRNEEQVRHYKSLLRDVYRDKSVKGYLYYLDLDRVVEV